MLYSASLVQLAEDLYVYSRFVHGMVYARQTTRQLHLPGNPGVPRAPVNPG